MEAIKKVIGVISKLFATANFIVNPFVSIVSFLFAAWAFAAYSSSFGDVSNMTSGWSSKPITDILVSTSDACPDGYQLIQSQQLSYPIHGTNGSSIKFSLARWRGRKICIKTSGVEPRDRPYATNGTCPDGFKTCGTNPSYLLCQKNEEACQMRHFVMNTDPGSAPGSKTLDFSGGNYLHAYYDEAMFPAYTFQLSNASVSTEDARLYLIDTIDEQDIFADNNVDLRVKRTPGSKWKIYNRVEILWKNDCGFTRNEVLLRFPDVLTLYSAQLVLFLVTVISTASFAICIPFCQLFSGQLKVIWCPERVKEEYIQARVEFNRYKNSNPSIWNEYQSLLSQRHMENKKEKNNRRNIPTPYHLQQMEQYHRTYSKHEGSRKILKYTAHGGTIGGGVIQVITFICAIITLLYSFKLVGFMTNVSAANCSDQKGDDSIKYLSNQISSSATWKNVIVTLFSVITLIISFISSIIAIINLFKKDDMVKEAEETESSPLNNFDSSSSQYQQPYQNTYSHPYPQPYPQQYPPQQPPGTYYAPPPQNTPYYG